MDLALDDTQRDVVDAVRQLLERNGGTTRARALGLQSHDDQLIASLHEAGFLDLAGEPEGPLLALLATEEVVRQAGQINASARLLVAPILLGDRAPLRIALAEAGDPLVRFGGQADMVLVADGDEARLVESRVLEPVPSAFGAPYARMDLSGGELVGSSRGDALRRWWRVGLAAEVAAALDAGLTLTVKHLTDRVQFGRPLASLQSLQHRLAELYVTGQEVRWLARHAASADAPAELSALAAGRAADAARQASPELHQLAGAIGFTLEFDLHLWTLRLESLRLELGGADAHFEAAAAAAW
jgi:hypothetical protein